jgi:hypothetical protein
MPRKGVDFGREIGCECGIDRRKTQKPETREVHGKEGLVTPKGWLHGNAREGVGEWLISVHGPFVRGVKTRLEEA